MVWDELEGVEVDGAAVQWARGPNGRDLKMGSR